MIKLYKIIAATALILPTALAFTSSASSQDQATTSAVPAQPEFAQLKADYLFQLEQYRNAQDKFKLDRAEFRKLETLATQEKAVASLKTLMVARGKVLTTYLSALEHLLIQAQGVDVSEKQIALNQLSATKSFISQHVQTIAALADRNQVLTESQSFEDQEDEISEAQNRTLALLAIGRVQSAFDQLLVSTDDFQVSLVQPFPESSQKQAILRGLNEVSTTNNAVTTSLKKAAESFSKFNDDEVNQNTSGVYNRVVSELQPAFSDMKKSIRFLIELERST